MLNSHASMQLFFLINSQVKALNKMSNDITDPNFLEYKALCEKMKERLIFADRIYMEDLQELLNYVIKLYGEDSTIANNLRFIARIDYVPNQLVSYLISTIISSSKQDSKDPEELEVISKLQNILLVDIPRDQEKLILLSFEQELKDALTGLEFDKVMKQISYLQ